MVPALLKLKQQQFRPTSLSRCHPVIDPETKCVVTRTYKEKRKVRTPHPLIPHVFYVRDEEVTVTRELWSRR